MAIKTIGIDLGKTVLVAVALDGRGRLAGPAQRYGRTGLVRWLANLPPCLIGMEASSGAHHLARTLQGQGHAVRLLPGQAVKPFRGAMKNDAADALAIAEAAHRHSNKVTVALANKLARIAWAVLAKNEDYRALPA